MKKAVKFARKSISDNRAVEDLHLYLKFHSFTGYFSNILLVKTNYLVYPSVEDWSIMG